MRTYAQLTVARLLSEPERRHPDKKEVPDSSPGTHQPASQVSPRAARLIGTQHGAGIWPVARLGKILASAATPKAGPGRYPRRFIHTET
jgi:hypothetical protein